MVAHPDQTGVPAGAVRFILSLRATGEGHISSITFRSGIVHRDLRIELDPAGSLLTEPRQIANTVYEGPLFQRKLWELGLESDFTRRVSGKAGELIRIGGAARRPGGRVARLRPSPWRSGGRSAESAEHLDVGPFQLRGAV